MDAIQKEIEKLKRANLEYEKKLFELKKSVSELGNMVAVKKLRADVKMIHDSYKLLAHKQSVLTELTHFAESSKHPLADKIAKIYVLKLFDRKDEWWSHTESWTLKRWLSEVEKIA